MLQQTQVKTVVPYWARWMRALPDLGALARAKPEKIHKLWEGLGYYTRVRSMQKAARLILEKHGGRFPDKFEEVLALPGIGRYTAGAICSIAFNQPTPVLDGNVIRVLTRLYGIGGNPRDKSVNARLWTVAEQLVQHAACLESASENRRSWREEALGCAGSQRKFEPPYVGSYRSRPGSETQAAATAHTSRTGRAAAQGRRITNHVSNACSRFNQALMELGALVCTPRQPQCSVCPTAKQCQALRQGRVSELPALGPRPRVTRRRFVAFVARRRDRYLVRQRPAGEVNGQLWEFPNVELTAEGFLPAGLPNEVLSRNRSRNRGRKPKRVFSVNRGRGRERGRGRSEADAFLPGPALAKAAQDALGSAPGALAPLCTLKHSITRYRITLQVLRATLSRGDRTPPAAGRWLRRGELERLAFTGAHRRILRRLGADGEMEDKI